MEGEEEGGEEAKRKKRNASQSQRPASSMLAACYATLRVEPLLPHRHSHHRQAKTLAIAWPTRVILQHLEILGEREKKKKKTRWSDLG